MSTSAGAPTNGPGQKSPESKDKGKAKSDVASPDVFMEEDDDDDDGDEDEEMEDVVDEDDDDDEDEEGEEVDPSAIIGRRTRGVKVDYTSKEALEKAGLDPEEEDDDDDDTK